MYTFEKIFTKISTLLRDKHLQAAIMVLVITLFVLSAGAPNAMGAIGK